MRSRTSTSSIPKLAARLSDDGRNVVSESIATNLDVNSANFDEQVFVADRDPNGDGLDGPDFSLTLISQNDKGFAGKNRSILPQIPGTGRHVAYQTNTDSGGSSVEIVLVDRDPDEDGFDGPDRSMRLTQAQGFLNGNSGPVTSLSVNGALVSFVSPAFNLVPGDGNGRRDLFTSNFDPDGNSNTADYSATRLLDERGVEFANEFIGTTSSGPSFALTYQAKDRPLTLVDRDPNSDGLDGTDRSQRIVSIGRDGREANKGTNDPIFSRGNGGLIGFVSQSSNLTTAPTNGQNLIYVRDRP